MLAGLLLACAAVFVPQNDDKADFTKRFNQAIKVSDRAAQDRAVQKYRQVAVNMFIDKTQTLSSADDWMTSFTASWKRLYRSDFPKIYSEYVFQLTPEQLKIRQKSLVDLFAVYPMYGEALQSRSPEDMRKIIEAVESGGILLNFMEVGDAYHQAICQLFLAGAYNTSYQDDGGDDFQALKAAENFVKLRKGLEYTNDRDYDSMQRALSDLRATLGVEDPEEAHRATKKSPYTIEAAEGADWIDVPLEAGVLSKPESIEFPTDIGDMDPRNWMAIAVAKEGETVNVNPAYGGNDVLFAGPAGPIRIERIRGTKFVIHAGAESSEEFSVGPKPKLVEFEQKLADGEVVPRALLIASGSESDTFQGITVNTGLNELGGVLFYRSVDLRVGDTPFGELTLYDVDSDGEYGKYPARVAGSPAMPTGVYFNRFDAITLGKSKKAMPFSRWIQDGDGNWYELEAPAHPGKAASVRIRAAAPKLGELKVKFKGPKGLKLTALVLRSEIEKTQGLRVDVSGKGPHMLPIGRYVLVQGMLRGKKGAECIIQPPADLPFSVIVDETEAAVMELGAPFKLYATPTVEEDMVAIDPESIRVVGTSGETYMQHLYAPIHEIEVEVKGGKSFKTSAAPAEMVGGNWHAAYFPVSGSVPLPKSGEAIIRLSVKKHPWFGKISSDWLDE